MAGAIRIVTDSSAQFTDPGVIRRHRITVVPLEIHLDSRLYHEGIDLSPEHFMQRLAEGKSKPILRAPGVEKFAAIYKRLSRETDRILSIHLSRAMHNTWQQAKLASESLLGRCDIAVLDSQSVSIGLAFLVEAAARLSEELESLDEVVRAVRKLISHIYAIFSVETLDYLRHNNLMTESQAILGTMLGIKPFLTIEEGELIAMEKVRTRSQVVDKLVEFVTEFAAVEQLVILQHTPHPTEQTRMLQERLAIEFADQVFPVSMYNPSLACYLGPEAMGIMVFESDLDEVDVPYDSEE